MKIELVMLTDSDNTNVEDGTVAFEVLYGIDKVWITIEGREVSVDKDEFRSLLKIV